MDKVDELLLEHFGTRGMKWGVRKSKGPSKISKLGKQIQKLGPENLVPPRQNPHTRALIDLTTKKSPSTQKESRKKLTPRQKDAILGTILVGTVAAGIIMNHNAHKKVFDVFKTVNIGSHEDNVRSLLNMAKDHRIPSPTKAKVAIPKVSAEHTKFLRQFNARQAIINRGANADLQRLYKQAGTAIKDREFLSEWK